MASDYIPDVEPEIKVKTPGNQPKTIKQLAEAWSKSFPDPMTFRDGEREFGKVVSFGWRVVDSLCSDTCPPANVLVPDLHKAIKDAEKLRDGFQVLVERGAGNVVWKSEDPRYQRAKTIGLRVFHESDLTVKRAAEEHQQISNLDPRALIKNKAGEFSFWKGAIAVTLGIVAVATFSDMIRAVRSKE